VAQLSKAPSAGIAGATETSSRVDPLPLMRSLPTQPNTRIVLRRAYKLDSSRHQRRLYLRERLRTPRGKPINGLKTHYGTRANSGSFGQFVNRPAQCGSCGTDLRPDNH
jgi:hypothetical protein